MTEEEYFRKNYPDSCYGDKPLSPYWDFFQDGVEFGERQSEKKIEELEQENTVLAQNLEDTEIVNKALEKENAELKADNDARKFAMAMSEKVEKQLREENTELRKEWQEQVQKAADEGYARTLQTIQLTNAKEIIKNLMVYVPVDLKEYEEAKQFLKDSEAEK